MRLLPPRLFVLAAAVIAAASVSVLTGRPAHAGASPVAAAATAWDGGERCGSVPGDDITPLACDLAGSRLALSFGRLAAAGPDPLTGAAADLRSRVRPGTDLDAAVRRANLFRTDLFLAGRWIPPAPPLTAARPPRDRAPLVPAPAVPAGPTPRSTLVPPPDAFAMPEFRLRGVPVYSSARGARRLYLDATPGF